MITLTHLEARASRPMPAALGASPALTPARPDAGFPPSDRRPGLPRDHEAGGLLGEPIELIVADDYCDGQQAVAAARKLIAEGVVFVAAKFRAEGYEPEGYALYAYAVIQVWAQAVKKAGSFDGEAVVDALRHNEFDTVLGRLSFDDKGDVTGVESFIWYIWSDSGYHPAESD